MKSSKKTMLVIAVTLLLAAALFVGAAGATGEVANAAEAAANMPVAGDVTLGSIGTFAELKAAIEGATGTAANPTVITLTGDITDGNEELNINGKFITINGAGNTLTITHSDAKAAILIKGAGAVTLKNITVVGPAEEPMSAWGKGRYTVKVYGGTNVFENVTIQNGTAAIQVSDSGTQLTLQGTDNKFIANWYNGIEVKDGGKLVLAEGVDVTITSTVTPSGDRDPEGDHAYIWNDTGAATVEGAAAVVKTHPTTPAKKYWVINGDANAAIGNVKYATVYDALKTCASGTADQEVTIKLLRNISEEGFDGAVTELKSMPKGTYTIDFDDHTWTIVGTKYAGSAPSSANQAIRLNFTNEADMKFTFQNGTLQLEGAAEQKDFVVMINSYTDLTLKNFTVDLSKGGRLAAGSFGPGQSAAVEASAVKLTLDNAHLIPAPIKDNTVETYAIWVDNSGHGNTPTVNLGNNSTLDGDIGLWYNTTQYSANWSDNAKCTVSGTYSGNIHVWETTPSSSKFIWETTPSSSKFNLTELTGDYTRFEDVYTATELTALYSDKKIPAGKNVYIPKRVQGRDGKVEIDHLEVNGKLIVNGELKITTTSTLVVTGECIIPGTLIGPNDGKFIELGGTEDAPAVLTISNPEMAVATVLAMVKKTTVANTKIVVETVDESGNVSRETTTITTPYDSESGTDPVYVVAHSITCADAEHGTITANKADAVEGDTITVTATPDSGYQLASLKYKYGGTETSILSTKSFTMPGAPVTVTATFSPKSSGSSSSSSSQGSSVWLTNDTPVQPTPTPIPTQAPVETPSVKPVTPTETPAKTPAPFLGILAGLGAAAVVFGLRRK